MEYKIEKREKTIIQNVITIDGVTVDFDDLMEILYELDETSVGCTMVIYDDTIKNLLIKLNVIVENVRGSCYRSNEYENFMSIMLSAVKQLYP